MRVYGSLLLIIVCIVYGSFQGFGQTIKLDKINVKFSKPVDISSTGISIDERIFITEKDGKIKILLSGDVVQDLPFLDIDDRVNSQANERGLLGMCFHPNYAENGYFYVHYTNNAGNSTISRFSRSTNNPNTADKNTEKIIMVVNQPFNNHNAGDLNFGPDGYLYIGMGDGGSGGDPGNRSQNPKDLLGKMLRIDVNSGDQAYLIPSDNPYINNLDTLPEIWAFGLRNPWRFSFDTLANEIWIADVGQDKWEEIDMAAIDAPKLNYGWRCYEGNEKFNFNNCSDTVNYTPPVFVYRNEFSTGCSVTGGYVYRGQKFMGLYGKYIYADFCTGKFWALYRNASMQWVNDILLDQDDNDYSTFGVDKQGELLVAGLASGFIYRISEKTSATSENDAVVHFTMFPNPANNQIEIKTDNPDLLEKEWLVFDMNGQVVMTQRAHRVLDKFILEILHLPKGVYALAPIDHSKSSKRFVKF